MPRQVYTVEIDGRQYDIEGDRPPTEAEARAVVESSRSDGLPEGGLAGALERLSRVERPISDTGEEYSDFGTRLQDFGMRMAHPTDLGGIVEGMTAPIDLTRGALPRVASAVTPFVRPALNAVRRGTGGALNVAADVAESPITNAVISPRSQHMGRILRAFGKSITPAATEATPAAASPVAQAVERLSATQGPVTQGTSVAAQELAASPSFRNLPTTKDIWADLPPTPAPVKLTSSILVERAAKAANLTLTADEAAAAAELVNQGNGPGIVIEAIQHMRAQQTGALELPASWNALPTPTEAETRFPKMGNPRSIPTKPPKPR